MGVGAGGLIEGVGSIEFDGLAALRIPLGCSSCRVGHLGRSLLN